LGELWEQKALPWYLELENPSKEPVEIVEFIPTCVCMGIDPPSLVVGPGSKARIRLTLDLTFRPPAQRDAAAWDFSTRVIPRLRQSQQKAVSWTLRARVRSLFNLSPRRVYLWDGVVRGQPLPHQTVSVLSHQPLKALTPNYDPNLLSVKALPDLKDSCRYQLEIGPNPSMPAGTFSTDIQLRGTTTQDVEPPPTTLTVQGWMQEEVQTIPGALGFGVRVVGETPEETVRLQATDGKSFVVQGIETDGEGVLVKPLMEEPHGYTVSQAIRKAGTQDTRVRFIVRTAGDRTFTVPLVITYCGLHAGEPGLAE
jgi:hypothetical protein